MRVKLLSIFETRFTYIFQKFLELPSLLRQLSVIIYSERSGARKIPPREIGERGEARSGRWRDKRASRNSLTVASSALLGATRFPLALNLGRESAGSKAHLRGDSRAAPPRVRTYMTHPERDVRRARYRGPVRIGLGVNEERDRAR